MKIFDDLVADMVKQINDSKDNAIAMAFTQDIAQLLKANGISPILDIHQYNVDFEQIPQDINTFSTVYTEKTSFAFSRLDTREHDMQVKMEVLNDLENFINTMGLGALPIKDVILMYTKATNMRE